MTQSIGASQVDQKDIGASQTYGGVINGVGFFDAEAVMSGLAILDNYFPLGNLSATATLTGFLDELSILTGEMTAEAVMSGYLINLVAFAFGTMNCTAILTGTAAASIIPQKTLKRLVAVGSMNDYTGYPYPGTLYYEDV